MGKVCRLSFANYTKTQIDCKSISIKIINQEQATLFSGAKFLCLFNFYSISSSQLCSGMLCNYILKVKLQQFSHPGRVENLPNLFQGIKRRLQTGLNITFMSIRAGRQS